MTRDVLRLDPSRLRGERSDVLDRLDAFMLDAALAETPPLLVEFTGFEGWADLLADAANDEPRWSRTLRTIADAPFPVVAVLAQDTVGPAWDLAIAADLRLVCRGIRIGPAVGRLPASFTSARLGQLLRPGAAIARLLSTEAALVDAVPRLFARLVPAECLAEARDGLVADIGRSSPLSCELIKEAVWRGVGRPLAEGLRVEHDLAVLLMASADRAEGLAAWAERRKPVFTGG